MKAEEVVKAAHAAWCDTATNHDAGEGWNDAPTLAYTVFALQHAHENSKLKKIALRLLSRVQSTDDAEHPRFAPLQAAAKAMSDALGPTLMEYRRQNDLCALLAPIKFEGSDGHLTQKGKLAFFDEPIPEEIHKRDWFEGNAHLAILINLICHYIGDEFVRRVGLLAHESKSKLKAAPHKSFQRMRTKAFNKGADYAGYEYAHPKSQYIKDPLRASLAAKDPAGQLKDWAALQQSDDFKVVGLKNTFAMDEAEAREATNGMMQILVNVEYKARDKDGEPLTFGKMVADKEGFLKAVEACKAQTSSNPRSKLLMAVGVCAEFLKRPELAERPIELLAEVQLHLDYYVEQRKQTHLWFKVLRATDLLALKLDCIPYRDAE